MITGIAHTAVCVPDLDEAVHWYTTALGLEVLMPPVLMKGEALERDMGELVPRTVLRGAILGFAESGDRVLEVLEYPEVDGRPRPADASVTDSRRGGSSSSREVSPTSWGSRRPGSGTVSA
jgi:catechol 2,3-dioxygenase-like lactoylglutathione lyase family enzyme